MAYRFDGISDLFVTSIGSAVATGAMSVAVLCRIYEDTEHAGIFQIQSSSDTMIVSLERRGSGDSNPNTLEYNNNVSNVRDVTYQVSDGWCVVGFSKATGTVVTQMHKVPLDGTVQHSNNGVTIASGSGTPTKIRFGHYGDGVSTQYSQIDIACAAWWNSQLTDANFNTLKNGISAWTALTPDDLWILDSTSTINDQVGSANETSRSGIDLLISPSPFGISTPNPVLRQIVANGIYRM